MYDRQTVASLDVDAASASRRQSVPDVAISDLMGQGIQPHEVAYFNGGVVFDDFDVQTRDTTDQVAFRDGNCEVFWYFSSQTTSAILNLGKLHSFVVALATFNLTMLLYTDSPKERSQL